MPDNQIFKATYSGIPVYEMMCKGVAVMRRRSDSWLNATQILKVAGFDKPQRTRILEREVQKGEHEKVQGGYGKYQGTWIPIERGMQIAKQYNCEHLLRPILDFQPASKSPPLAPKHLISTSTKPPRKEAGIPGISTRSSRRNPSDHAEDESEMDTFSVRASEDGSMTPSPSEASSSSRTPSPIRSPGPSHAGNGSFGSYADASPGSGRPHKQRRTHDRPEHDYEMADPYAVPAPEAMDPAAYAEQVLEYFISDANQIPPILIHPPPDFDPNIAIDDDGHTALHWAAAMGRIRIVKLLLTAGADIFKVNKAGQTALMRSVMFANNYDVRKFPELYELLHRSTLNIDNFNRTVFHHIVDVAMSKGKSHAARYYLETVLGRLSDYPQELADVINFQDEDGETALTMAARCRSKRLVKLLIDHGADPKIVNNDGKSTEDYILEDERFRMSPAPPSRAVHMSFRNAQAAYPSGPGAGPNWSAPVTGEKAQLHYSASAQKASTRVVNEMAAMLDNLAASFDAELREKDRDTNQVHALLGNIQAEILESQRAVGHLKVQAQGLGGAKLALKELEDDLAQKMGRRYRLGWEKWVKDEEEREAAVRESGNGALLGPELVYREDELMGSAEPGMGGAGAGPVPLQLGGAPDGETDPAKGKRKAVTLPDEDISDLIDLHSNIPTDPAALREECERLRHDIGHHRKRRKDAFDASVRFQAEAGTFGRMSEYRRLIGAGCGGVPPAEVDSFVGMLLEALEAEEPASSSSMAWTGAAAAPATPRSVPSG